MKLLIDNITVCGNFGVIKEGKSLFFIVVFGKLDCKKQNFLVVFVIFLISHIIFRNIE